MTDLSLNAQLRPAVFFDRDGTVTLERGFVTTPEQIVLVHDSRATLRDLQDAGFRCVLITNQSAIGRGMITEQELIAIHVELVHQLEQADCILDAIYHCPDMPNGSPETAVTSSERKPSPAMLLAAARDLDLDLSRSWMVGDRISDVLAGSNAGCRGNILIRSNRYPEGIPEVQCKYETVDSLLEAADLILSASDIAASQESTDRRE